MIHVVLAVTIVVLLASSAISLIVNRGPIHVEIHGRVRARRATMHVLLRRQGKPGRRHGWAIAFIRWGDRVPRDDGWSAIVPPPMPPAVYLEEWEQQ